MQTESDDLESQIAAIHLEVFGVESAERQEHRAQVIARLRAQAAKARGPTAWKRRFAEKLPTRANTEAQ